MAGPPPPPGTPPVQPLRPLVGRRLLWKGIGSEETKKAVLDICSGLGIEGYFPFPYLV